MSESYLTLKQLVEVVDIPENSVKRYMNEHEEFVRFDKMHNRYRIHVSAVETLKTIRRLYGEGLKREAVDEYLRGSGIPVTITVDSEEGTDLINVNEKLDSMEKMMQAQFLQNQKLHEELVTIKQELNSRDARMIKQLKDSMEEQAATKESEKVSDLRKTLEAKQRDELMDAIDSASEKAAKEVLDEYREFMSEKEAEKNSDSRGSFWSRLFK